MIFSPIRLRWAPWHVIALAKGRAAVARINRPIRAFVFIEPVYNYGRRPGAVSYSTGDRLEKFDLISHRCGWRSSWKHIAAEVMTLRRYTNVIVIESVVQFLFGITLIEANEWANAVLLGSAYAGHDYWNVKNPSNDSVDQMIRLRVGSGLEFELGLVSFFHVWGGCPAGEMCSVIYTRTVTD